MKIIERQKLSYIIIILYLLIGIVSDLCAQNVYRIRAPSSSYSVKLVGVTGTETEGEESIGVYSTRYQAHEFNIYVTGPYLRYNDPTGGTSWVLDTNWSTIVGKELIGNELGAHVAGHGTGANYKIATVDIEDSSITTSKLTTAINNTLGGKLDKSAIGDCLAVNTVTEIGKSGDKISGSVTLVEGSNITITRLSQDITISSSGVVGSTTADSAATASGNKDFDELLDSALKIDTTANAIDTTKWGNFIRNHQSSGGGGDFSASDFPDSLAAHTELVEWSDTTGTIATQYDISGFISGNESITLSGDATGSGTTAITVTVGDDNHNHTTTTISGLDISDDTNLSANSPAVLTDDVISVDTTIVATKHWVNTNIAPDTSASIAIPCDYPIGMIADTSWIWVTDRAITIDSLYCESDDDGFKISLFKSDAGGGGTVLIDSVTTVNSGNISGMYYATQTTPITSSVSLGDRVGFPRPTNSASFMLAVLFFHWSQE